MNIALIAPAKFDFQDLACIDIALRWPLAGSPSLQIEPQDGEDAEIRWRDGGAPRVCEIQVKGRSTKAISMATLAEYLTHFPERKACDCLLERLLADPHRIVLFIATERCCDDVAAYRTDADWAGAPRMSAPQRRDGKALAAALTAIGDLPTRAGRTPSKLAAARARRIGDLAQTDLDGLAEALQRVFVQEQETTSTIDVRLQRRLTADGVPTDVLSDGVGRLKMVVADHRGHAADVIGPLHSALAEFAPRQVAPARYVDRGIEVDFEAQLSRDGAILLSGPPRVGKSWAALRLAGALQQHGYEVAKSSHIDQAERFLSDPVRRPRVFVLEDPFGARQAAADVSARISDLRRLLGGLTTDRRLIVAQSEAPILQAMQRPDLAACRLGTFAWQALGALSAAQADVIWRSDARAAGLDPAIVERVALIIRAHPDFRDVGALAYLATNFDQLRPGVSDVEIVAHARGDAVDFARALADENPQAGSVLKGMAVATETGVGAEDRELAFIIDGDKSRPSFDQSDGIVIYGRPQEMTAPRYAQLPVLADALREAAVVLRRRRVLDQSFGRLNFTHPYMRAGAQALLRPDLPEDIEAVAALAERALAAADSTVSLAAARNLEWISGALEGQEDGSTRGIALAEAGLRSVYPATRDACYAFLISRAGELSADDRQRVARWVHAACVEFDQIEQVDGLLLVGDSMNAFWRNPSAVPFERIAPYLDAIEAGQPVDLDTTLAYRILVALRGKPKSLTPKLMGRLLSVDAAVIRAAACELWLERPRTDDGALLARIAADTSPSISIVVLDVLVRAWSLLGDTRRSAVQAILAAHARSPGSATLLIQRLARFNRLEEFGETPPWVLFSAIAPIALGHAAVSFLRDGRLYQAIHDAIRVGEGDRLLPLLEAWAIVIETRSETKVLDDFELAIPEPMLEAGPPEWRWPILQRLLAVANTGTRIRIVAALVEEWEALAPTERQGLIAMIGGDRGDELWLKAAALTRREVPEPIVAAIVGDPKALALPTDDLLARIGEPLYRASLHVFLGAPQPLWWIGGHHSRSQAWQAAVLWSASGRTRPLHALALKEVVADDLDDQILIDLIDDVAPKDLSALFEIFLDRKIEENGNWRQRPWIRLLDRGEEAGFLDDWFDLIDPVAPAILHSLSDIRYWFGDGPHAERLMNRFRNDLLALLAVRAVLDFADVQRSLLKGESVDDEDDAELGGNEKIITIAEMLKPLDLIADRTPPRLLETWRRMRDTMERFDGPADAVERMEAGRLKAIHDHFEERRAHLPEDQSALVGWIGPR